MDGQEKNLEPPMNTDAFTWPFGLDSAHTAYQLIYFNFTPSR
jgi:hypothetical protein